MKKPEPWPMVKLRPRGPRGRSGVYCPSGMPKRRKKRSIGEPGGKGESPPSKLIVRGPPSTLTRTEITEGFTFSTISAKPTGRCAVWAYAGDARKVDRKSTRLNSSHLVI